MKVELNDLTACMLFPSSAESRFLQSVDEDNMTKQPGVSAISFFWFIWWRTQNLLEQVFSSFFGQKLSHHLQESMEEYSTLY